MEHAEGVGGSGSPVRSGPPLGTCTCFRGKDFFTSQTMERSGLRRSNDVGSFSYGKGHWVALISLSSSLRMASTLQPSLPRKRCVRSFVPCSNAAVVVVVQIGIIPSLPRPFDLCQRPKSIADRAPIHSLSLACLPVRNSDGPEGECTTNESHPEHAPPLPLLDPILPRAPRSFSLWQCPNAFPIGFDCIRIFEVLLGCGCERRGREGGGRPLEPLWPLRRRCSPARRRRGAHSH